MIHKKQEHRRRSIRLKHYDYSSPGAYFLTLCSHEKQPLFGRIEAGLILVSPMGEIVASCWRALPERFPEIELDSFIVMPNHIHGIIMIARPPAIQVSGRRHMLLSKVVGYLKMNTAKEINAMRGTPGRAVWQRDYFEHVIRNEQDLSMIREYIINNPAKWLEDPERMGCRGDS